VAIGLIDGALAPKLGFQRLHRHAVRLHAAVAAAFAHQLVDDDALVGIGILPALAPPALFGRAGLIVNQHGAARDRRELALHRVEILALVDRHPGRPLRLAGVTPALVGDEHDARGSLGRNLTGDLVDGEAAVILLTTGHSDRVVAENLV